MNYGGGVRTPSNPFAYMNIQSYYHQLPQPYCNTAITDCRRTRGASQLRSTSAHSLDSAIDYGIIWGACRTEWCELTYRYRVLGGQLPATSLYSYPELL